MPLLLSDKKLSSQPRLVSNMDASTSKPPPPTCYEDLLLHAGEWGPWQWKVWIVLWLPVLGAAMSTLSWVFTAFQLRCNCEEMHGAQDNSAANISTFHDSWNATDLNCDYSVRKDSILLDLKLFCGDEWFAALISPMFMAGMLLGAPTFGFLSDNFGRKRMVLTSVLLLATSGCSTVLLPHSKVWHSLTRLSTGFGAGGVMVCSFVYLIEGPRQGKRWRLVAALSLHLGWNFGQALLVFLAYTFRGWKELHLVIHIICYGGLLIYFLVPESPRWLISKGRLNEAICIVNEMAQKNGKTVPTVVQHALVQPPPLKAGVIPKHLIVRLLNLSFQWFATNLCYYGIHYSSAQLYGDIYINFPLLLTAEISANLFSHLVILPYLGQKKYLGICQVLCSSVLLLCTVIPTSFGIIKICLTIVGKFAATSNFNCIYFYTCELFPTSMRSTAIGICTTVGRFGAMVAMACVYLNVAWKLLPFIIMSVPAALAAVILVKLPETKNCVLPETIEEAGKVGDENQPKCHFK